MRERKEKIKAGIRKGINLRGPRKIVTARQVPRICPRMIPLRSRFDSALFTPKMLAIAGYSNFSRSPIDIAGAP